MDYCERKREMWRGSERKRERERANERMREKSKRVASEGEKMKRSDCRFGKSLSQQTAVHSALL